ncbi:uncharacterized protein LOC135842355 [Planococcus citri]|uniref:uncharacterized protein LOC135842355 n=1 Tax=Planococcus citri TaxID=170843 RepID=UPI0031FA33E2
MISGKGLNTIMVGFMAIAVFILFDISRTTGTVTVFGKEVNCNLQKSHEITVEDKAKLSPLVLHTLAVYTNPLNLTAQQSSASFSYSAHFWLISVYKGAEDVARYFQIPDVDDVAIYNVHDRKVNVTGFYKPANDDIDSSCWKPVVSQKYYILFAEIKDGGLIAYKDDQSGAIVDWTEENEARVWRGLGWNDWSDWAACSATCGEGTQERRRYCSQSSCVGYNKERRRCNMFPCEGTIEPLATENQKYFHPSRSLWEKVPDRGSAWRIKPSYYLWLPAKEVAFPVADFQRHFALIVSVRVDPTVRTEGTIFSLRSRSQPSTYLSLNLDGPDVIRLIQSTPNGTQSVAIPAAIADGHWHQLALGIQDNVSVRSYLDCRWVSTDILRSNSLSDTEDADLIIGYLFTGDLEHLILVPDSAAVVQQCSTSKISVLDKALLKNAVYTTLSPEDDNSQRLRRRHHSATSDNRKRLIPSYFEIKTERMIVDTFDDDDDNDDDDDDSTDSISDDEDDNQDEGSGSGPIFGMEWSSWSECSTKCGAGIQTRHLRCVNLMKTDEPCPISETEHTETRPCKLAPCKSKSKWKYSAFRNQHPFKHKSDNYVDDGIKMDKKKFYMLKKHRIHEEDLSDTKSCKCLNGGICDQEQYRCKCPSQFTGNLCEIPIQNTCSTECQNGGTCIDGKCRCPPGYTGSDCSSQICELKCEPGEICPPATTCDCDDSTKFKCNNTTTCRPCLNGGICNKNKCTCTPGWNGVDCSIAVCKPSCKNGGYCIKPNECLCRPGTTGSYCENDTCGSGCLNDGVCVGYGICKCPPNVTGTMCETLLCDPPCENGATCSANNVCLCTEDMNSPRCATKKCNYKAIRKPYTVGVRRLAKRKYSSECKENLPECSSRLVPKFQTVYRTLYRTVYECENNESSVTFS